MTKRIISLLLTTILLLTAIPATAASPEAAYNAAFSLLQQGDYDAAAEAYASLGFYGDASLMALYCAALDAGASGNYAAAALNFEALGTFRDAPLYARYYTARWYETGEKYEEAADVLAGMTLFLDAGERLTGYPALILARDAAALEARNAAAYAEAAAAEEAGQLEAALTGFTALGAYRNSAARANSVAYKIADLAEKNGDYITAFNGFTALGSYSDSAERAAAVEPQASYATGLQYVTAGEFSKAYDIFSALGDYEDSAEKAYVLRVTKFASRTDRQGDGIATFCFHDKWGVLNILANSVSTPYWDVINNFNSYGLARVYLDKKYAYIDSTGCIVVPHKWDQLSYFCNGICVGAVKEASPVNVLYKNFPLTLIGTDGIPLTDNRWTAVANVANTAWNGYNNTVSTEEFSFTGNLIRVRDTNNKWGYIDLTGNVVIEPQYDGARDFCSGLAAVCCNGLWGYIDEAGNTVITNQYSEAYDFNDGMAHVYLPQTGWQIIDSQGTLLYFISSTEDAASSEEPDSPPSMFGQTWVLTDIITSDGEAENPMAEMLAYGISITLVVNESDLTLNATMAGYTETTTYDCLVTDSTMTFEGNVCAYTYDGTTLTLDSEGIIMVFTRP